MNKPGRRRTAWVDNVWQWTIGGQHIAGETARTLSDNWALMFDLLRGLGLIYSRTLHAYEIEHRYFNLRAKRFMKASHVQWPSAG